MENLNTHNRLVAGSNPAEPTSELQLFKKSYVLPEPSELLQLRDLLYILLGNEGRRQLELRQKTNQEL